MNTNRLIILNLRLTILRGVSASCRFKRYLSVFKRFEIYVLTALLASVTASQADPLNLDARDNALGSANSFGHARMVRALGELPVGGGASYPIKLVFNSNPAQAPGAFGPYWGIPLFDSVVVQFNQHKLYWDGPDERRQFFVLDQAMETRRGEKVFIERGKDWKATVDNRGGILIEALDDSGWVFSYDAGRLQAFKLGASADECRMTYSGRGLPLYITNQANNRRIFEIEYRGSTEAERIIIGEKEIAVVMGDAELTAPDGVTNYRNHRVSFLRSITLAPDPTEYFSYSKSDTRTRKVTTLVGEAEKKVVKIMDLAVNRIEISSDSQTADASNWLEWEAKSGFVTSDSGSSYNITNNAWDPNIQDGPFDVTPSAVNITRLPIGGKEQKWSYHWNSGVRVYTDLATGEIIRRTVIMSEGPANGKLRKREVLNDGNWTLDRKNSYDPKGRPVRAVHGDSIRIWKWEDSLGGSEATETLNGALEIRSLFTSGRLVMRERYKPSGLIVQQTFDVAGRVLEVREGGLLVSKSYYQDGLLTKRELSTGRHEVFTYAPDSTFVRSVLRPDLRRPDLTQAVEFYYYDATGTLIQFVNAFGKVTDQNKI